MVFFWFVIIIAMFLILCFLTLSFAAALYYIVEIIEEYVVKTKKVIRYACFLVSFCLIGLLIFEGIPFINIAFALAAQGCHLMVLRSYPLITLSIESVSSILLFVINNYLTLSYFGNEMMLLGGKDYHIIHIISYFLVCIWLIPLSLFISLTANDNILPTTNEIQRPAMNEPLPGQMYNSRRQAKYSVKSFFDFVKENYLPQTGRKLY